jgi:Ca-activated chloride channel family protein
LDNLFTMIDLLTAQTALPAAWSEAREFLADIRLARPGLLWLALLPVAVVVLGWLTAWRQRKRLLALGRPGTVAGLTIRPRRLGWLTALAALIGGWLLVVGLAGPQWGTTADEGVAVGRDVVLVLDLSRSMWAADMASAAAPERWQAAVAGAVDLVDAVQRSGGHRIGLVLFAARPRVVAPLTTDFDHVRQTLAIIDARIPPPETRPVGETAGSGTRIGAALRAAVAAHDSRFPGYQDIILVTDGDDPGDDREWLTGVTAARTAGIPVHVVGVGDPNRESLIFHNGEPLEVVNEAGVAFPVQTRLHEDIAQAIADEARGVYLPARRDVPRLGEFFRTRIEPYPTRELADDLLPQPKDRAAWFFAAAAVVLFLTWLRER